MFTIHATKVMTTHSNNDIPAANSENHPPSNTADPAAELQSLAKALTGNWSTTYEFAPGGVSLSGGTGTGEENWRTGPGGFVLMEDEHVREPAGEMFLSATSS